MSLSEKYEVCFASYIRRYLHLTALGFQQTLAYLLDNPLARYSWPAALKPRDFVVSFVDSSFIDTYCVCLACRACIVCCSLYQLHRDVETLSEPHGYVFYHMLFLFCFHWTWLGDSWVERIVICSWLSNQRDGVFTQYLLAAGGFGGGPDQVSCRAHMAASSTTAHVPSLTVRWLILPRRTQLSMQLPSWVPKRPMIWSTGV